MNIRTKISIQFTLIIAVILLLFTIGIYFFSSNYRLKDYTTRLKDRAFTSARLLLNVKEVDETLLKIIDKNTLALYRENIFIFDENNKQIYSNTDQKFADQEVIGKVREYEEYIFNQKERDAVGVLYHFDNHDYIIIASAHDIYGIAKIRNLRIILIVGLLLSLSISVLAGRVFAGRALQPISRVVSQVKEISISNLNQRLDEGNQKDEIAQLSITFNRMLKRLEEAFILQREFVSNAAHELRTPFTVMLAEIDYCMMHPRKNEQYIETLKNLSKELKKLSRLSNGLLDLARINFNKQTYGLTPVRIDELLIDTCNEVLHTNNGYKTHINFDCLPNNENILYVNGNEQLLKIAFKNLIENACKFSDSKSVTINILFDKDKLEIQFSDNGIGISQEDLPNIFQPFYRGTNTQFIAGYGLGLALTQKITELHNGKVTVKSTLGEGSVFSIIFPGKASTDQNPKTSMKSSLS